MSISRCPLRSSLRWHYPNQVYGSKFSTSSQPIYKLPYSINRFSIVQEGGFVNPLRLVQESFLSPCQIERQYYNANNYVRQEKFIPALAFFLIFDKINIQRVANLRKSSCLPLAVLFVPGRWFP